MAGYPWPCDIPSSRRKRTTQGDNGQRLCWLRQIRSVSLLQQKALEHRLTHQGPGSFLTNPRGLEKSALAQDDIHV